MGHGIPWPMYLAPEEFGTDGAVTSRQPDGVGRVLESTFLDSEAYQQFSAARAEIRQEFVTVVQGYHPVPDGGLFGACLSQLVRIGDEVASRHGIELDYQHVHVGVAASPRVFGPPGGQW